MCVMRSHKGSSWSIMVHYIVFLHLHMVWKSHFDEKSGQFPLQPRLANPSSTQRIFGDILVTCKVIISSHSLLDEVLLTPFFHLHFQISIFTFTFAE